MKSWFKFTLLFLAVGMLGMAAGYLSVSMGGSLLRQEPQSTEAPVLPISKTQEGVEDDLHPSPSPSPAPAEQVFTEGYVVQESDGEICVFRTTTSGERVFSQKLKISLSSLRSEDQKRFREGFTVGSKAELAQLIEDFGS